MLCLVEAADAHWAWLCGEQPNPGHWLLPEGGLEGLPTLRMLRRISDKLRSAACRHSYLIAHGKELVGLCGYKHPSHCDKSVEIGFGIAAARRNCAYATSAVKLLLAQAAGDARVDAVLAETHVDNLASQCVLQRTGFVRRGTRP